MRGAIPARGVFQRAEKPVSGCLRPSPAVAIIRGELIFNSVWELAPRDRHVWMKSRHPAGLMVPSRHALAPLQAGKPALFPESVATQASRSDLSPELATDEAHP